MVLDTFRWFMSTVAQTLGAVSAIILAAYIMWIPKMRTIREETKIKYSKWYYSITPKDIIHSVVTYFHCYNMFDLLEVTMPKEAKAELLRESLPDEYKLMKQVIDKMVILHKLYSTNTNEALAKMNEYATTSVKVKESVIEVLSYLNNEDLHSFFNMDISRQEIEEMKRQLCHQEEHEEIYNKLISFHDTYYNAGQEIRKARQLWIPLLLSFATIIGSLGAMMFDVWIANYAPVAWDWIISGTVMLFAGTSLGWYFVFLYRVISPRSKREQKKQA